MKIDKKAAAGAIGLLMLSWAAFPFLYLLLVKRGKEKKNEMEDEKKNESLGQA